MSAELSQVSVQQVFVNPGQTHTTESKEEKTRLVSADCLIPGSFTCPPEKIGLTPLGGRQWILADSAESFPFFAFRKDTGQFIWRSKGPVVKSDVKKIVDLAQTHHQSVHINTGTHGNPKGATLADYDHLAEYKFTLEDFDTAVKATQVSVHTLSSGAPAEYPENANQVIDAWCYSTATENHKRKAASLIGRCSVCQEQQSLDLEPTISHINIIEQKAENPRKCTVQDHPEIKYTTLEIYKRRHVVVYRETTSSQTTRIEDQSGSETKSYDIGSQFFKFYNLTI